MCSYLNIVGVLINSMRVKVANVNELKPGEGKVVIANGRELALFNVNGKFFCIDNECPHRSGPLGEGFLDDYIVTCPLHAAQYDVRTGKFLSQFPPSHDVESFRLEVKGEDIFVD